MQPCAESFLLADNIKDIRNLEMTPVYRRLLFALFYLVSLVVVVLVAAYVGRNFTGSGPAPTRSSFAGRLPGTPDGDFRRFQFFYTTNRATDDPETFDGQGSKLGSAITAGTFDVRISP